MKYKLNLALFYFLSFTWGLIWTLIGLSVFAFVKLIYKDKIVVSNYMGRIKVVFKEKKFGGINLGIVFFVDKNDRIHTSLHELGHSIQNIMFGPLFLFLVAIPSGIRYQLFDWLSKRHYKKHSKFLDYDSAWFEGQATSLGYSYYKKYSK